MQDISPEYHAYYVTFYSTYFDAYGMPISNFKGCVVLARDGVEAENIAESIADKQFPNNCNTSFEAHKLYFHEVTPFGNVEGDIIHYNPN